jgi:hypothetical protein
MAFPTLAEYESLIYGLPDKHSEIVSSTLRIYSTSALTAAVEGEIEFNSGLRLRVAEAIDFSAGLIRKYGYTVYRGEERIRWFDPQPHPGNPALAETFPHHYHESPDIKHNRRPAPGFSFTSPNLPALIADCIQLGKTIQGKEF